MLSLRLANDRGHAEHGWLNTYHTFSFADYQDPNFMGFRKLRVINEDRVQAGQGFGTHSHRDMEIISYVLEGQIEHEDSMGNGSIIKPGDVQRMSAGTGVTHSEFNPSKKELLHFLQIWILPEKTGLEPSYEQRSYKKEDRHNKLCLAASRDIQSGVVKIHQDVNLFVSLLDKDAKVEHRLKEGRHAWLQVAGGSVTLNKASLSAGDGAAISNERLLTITAKAPAEILLFDLA